MKYTMKTMKFTALALMAILIPLMVIQSGTAANPNVTLTISQTYQSDTTVEITDESSSFTVPKTAMDFVNASAEIENIALHDYNWTGEQDAHQGSYSIDDNGTGFSFICPYNCTLAYVSFYFEWTGTGSEDLWATLTSSYYNETMGVPMRNSTGFGDTFNIDNVDGSGWWTSEYAATHLDPALTYGNTWFIRLWESLDPGNDIKVRWISDAADGDSDDESIVCFYNHSISDWDVALDPVTQANSIDILASVVLEPLAATPNATVSNLEINGVAATDGASNDGSWFDTTQPTIDNDNLLNNVSVDWFNYSMDIVSRTSNYAKTVSGLQFTPAKSFGVTTGYSVSYEVTEFAAGCGNYRIEYSVPSEMEAYGLKLSNLPLSFTTATVGGSDLVRADSGVGFGTYVLIFSDPAGERTSNMVQIGVYAGAAGLVILAGVIIMVKKKKDDDALLLDKYGGDNF